MQWRRKREAKKKDADAATVQTEPHPFKQNRAAEKQGKADSCVAALAQQACPPARRIEKSLPHKPAGTLLNAAFPASAAPPMPPKKAQRQSARAAGQGHIAYKKWSAPPGALR